MVLVAVGTLAIVLLQLSSKRSNLDAAQRATAAQVGYAFLERIRGNNTQTGLLAYEAAAANGFDGADGYNQNYAGPNCGAGASCTAQQLAQFDSQQFERELAGAAETVGGANTGGLVSPVACLTFNPTGGVTTNLTLTIVWRGAVKGGVEDTTTDTNVVCGNDLAIGANRVYGADDEYRRYLILNAFVARRDL